MDWVLTILTKTGLFIVCFPLVFCGMWLILFVRRAILSMIIPSKGDDHPFSKLDYILMCVFGLIGTLYIVVFIIK